MSWSAPHTFLVLELVTAATMNTYVSNDLSDLNRRTTPVEVEVITAETTTSTTPAALATAGPAATVTIGSAGVAIVILSCDIANSAANGVGVMGFDISGASTATASDKESLALTSWTANARNRTSYIYTVVGLSAGATTFTAKYWVNANTGTFQYRQITVIPLSA